MTTWNNGKYMLLRGFAKDSCDIKNFQKLADSTVLHRYHKGIGNSLRSVIANSDLAIYKFLEKNSSTIRQAVEKKFRFDKLIMQYALNQMKHGDGIDMHNDWFDLNETHHPDAIVARGILTLNPTYVFGTDTYASEDKNSFIKEFGGYPGDLFIFKCSPDSWHSVGFKKENHVDRFSMNFVFKLKHP